MSDKILGILMARMSDWDQFQKELSELPINELLSIYEETYNKVTVHYYAKGVFRHPFLYY